MSVIYEAASRLKCLMKIIKEGGEEVRSHPHQFEQLFPMTDFFLRTRPGDLFFGIYRAGTLPSGFQLWDGGV